jgi:hypothetical protein
MIRDVLIHKLIAPIQCFGHSGRTWPGIRIGMRDNGEMLNRQDAQVSEAPQCERALGVRSAKEPKII